LRMPAAIAARARRIGMREACPVARVSHQEQPS
jgi:hypothetical protein